MIHPPFAASTQTSLMRIRLSLVANRLAGRSPRSHPYGDAKTDTRGDRISVAGQTPPKGEQTGHRIPQIEYASYPRTEVVPWRRGLGAACAERVLRSLSSSKDRWSGSCPGPLYVSNWRWLVNNIGPDR